MLNIIIVDDEKIMREGLVKTIPWSKWGFNVVGCAENGKIAYDIVKKNQPDVILTDIRMPAMDGIELLKKVKSEYPQIEVVLLSGYEEFEFAKQGLNYGAFAYVLKLNIMQELEKSMMGVREKIENVLRNRELQKQGKATVLVNHAREVLYGDTSKDRNFDETISKYEKYDFIAAVFHLNNYFTNLRTGGESKMVKRINEIKFAVNEYIPESTENFILLRLKENELTLIRIYDKEYRSIKEMFRNEIQQIMSSLSENNDMETSFVIGMGNPYRGWQGLYSSYQQARHATMYYIVDTPISFIDVSDLERFKRNSVKGINYNLLKEIEKKLFFASEMNNIDEVISMLDDWFDVWNNNGNIIPGELRQSCIEVLSIIKRRLEGMYHYNENSPGLDMEVIYNINNISNLKEYMTQSIMSLFKTVRSVNEDLCPVQKVVNYLEEYFMEKISLKEIAEYVYVNPSYLSVAFRKKTGKSFTDYLIELKIQKACEFIKNGMKVYEAAEKVGYSDIKHFREMFKKYTGVNPGEY